MPRGKSKSYEDRIAELDAKIASYQEKIDALEAKKKEIKSAQKLEMADKVVRILDEKGLSLEEVLEAVEKQ